LTKKILNDLIEQELLLKEATTHNIVITPAELDSEVQRVTENYPGKEFEKMLINRHLTPNEWREVTKKSLLLKKTFNRLTDTKIELKPQQISDYYEKNKDKFQLPDRAHALHILVDSEQDAFDVQAQLRKGTPFETLARERSLGPEAQSGGDLGYFAKGSMPELFDEVIFSLEVGKVSRVVHSEYGYHLFKLLDHSNAHLRTLDECHDEIGKILEANTKQEIYSKWLEQALKSTKIKTNHALLAKLNF
jgi:peptidyl-prolyl cis-trans isomerase C